MSLLNTEELKKQIANGTFAHSVQTGHQTRRASGHLQRDIFYDNILA